MLWKGRGIEQREGLNNFLKIKNFFFSKLVFDSPKYEFFSPNFSKGYLKVFFLAET